MHCPFLFFALTDHLAVFIATIEIEGIDNTDPGDCTELH